MPIDKVDIKPGMGILRSLRYLSYKPWYAFAEFVDNALQSYLSEYDALKEVNGKQHRLIIRIDIDPSDLGRISIKDDAAGISMADYERAFRPAEVPPDASGLSEFGMGMKSAACWLASEWIVRTSALGEDVERELTFNVDSIVDDDISELKVDETPANPKTHFTEIVLKNLHNKPMGRTLGKIKEHLTDIYRDFTRRGDVMIFFNGDALLYENPNVLCAPYYLTPDKEPVKWKKVINLDLGSGLKASGFAGLRDPGSTTHAGFALFRRRRLIQGSGDEGYRPQAIFGQSNDYRYQRLFGELHLEGIDVSHTKDGFQWKDENEELFLERLKDALDSDELPLLKQAQGYRALETREKLKKRASKAVVGTAEVITSHVPEVLPDIATKPPIETSVEEATHKNVIANKILDIEFADMKWKISIEAIQDIAESQWLILNDIAPIQDTPRKLDIRLNLAHPFVVRFGQAEASALEAQMRMGAAIAMSEVLAKDAGIQMSGTFRRNLNQILTEVMGQPS